VPPQTLVAAVKNRTVVPFIGTGLSVSVGRGIFPDWRGLIERLAARLESEGLAPDANTVRGHLAAQRFPEAAELAFEKLTPSRFGEVMRKAFDVEPPDNADLSAVEALWRIRPTALITTNYDDVLRWPLARAGRPDRFPRVAHNDDPDLLQQFVTPAPDERPLIWHLHGSVERPGTMILTERQYQLLYGAASEQLKQYAFALQQLRTLVANRTLLFVGFSLADPFVRAQLKDILAVTAAQNPVSFVLLKKGEKDADALLAEQHVQVIEFDDFGPSMVRAIAEIADAAWGVGQVATQVEKPVQPLNVADIDDVLNWGWDGTKLLDAFIALDYATLADLTPEDEGDSKQWAPIFMDQPQTWRMLTTEPKVIKGYWHFAPLFPADFARAKAGELLDSEIKADRVQTLAEPGQYDIYFVQLCLHSRFRRPSHKLRLFRSVLSVLDELRQDGIFIREVCANAYTPEGASVCTTFHMQPGAKHRNHGTIYSAPIAALLTGLGPAWDSLCQAYRNAGLL
jgi:hypothetical protein